MLFRSDLPEASHAALFGQAFLAVARVEPDFLRRAARLLALNGPPVQALVAQTRDRLTAMPKGLVLRAAKMKRKKMLLMRTTRKSKIVVQVG